MWFIFPQIDGLGRSPTARHYAIASLHHAREYLADPVLGPRLRKCCEALLALPPIADAERVLGPTDALKLRSCVTLFAHAAGDEAAGSGARGDDAVFRAVLERFYAGAEDEATIRLLEADPE